MCIIIYKPAGLPVPNTLKDCWNNNPDGAGYCFPKKNGEIKIKKGFMTWKSFEDSLANVSNPENMDMLFHFRIATHGGVNKEFTHPFPLSDKMHHLKSTRATAPMAICHNGIISEFGSKTVSDTADYIANVAYPLFKATRMEQSDYTDTVIENTIEGSRFATMTSKEVRLIGHWFMHDGCYYSNENYKPKKYYYDWGRYNTSWDYSDDDWWDDYDKKYDTRIGDATGTLYRLTPGFFVVEDGEAYEVTAFDNYYMDEFGMVYTGYEYSKVYEYMDAYLSDKEGNFITDQEILALTKSLECIGKQAIIY